MFAVGLWSLMKPVRRILLATLGALAAVGAVVVALLFINADEGFIGATVTHPFGWLAPLAAGVILGAATWVLLDQPRSRRHDDASYDAGTCPECDREILGQWRMCPYCGALLTGGHGSQSEAAPVARS